MRRHPSRAERPSKYRRVRRTTSLIAKGSSGVLAARAATMRLPGAAMSGLTASRRCAGPWLEKVLRRVRLGHRGNGQSRVGAGRAADLCLDAEVAGRSDEEGAGARGRVCSLPGPRCPCRRSDRRRRSGSTTRAPSVAAHSMPAMMSDVSQFRPPQTLPIIRSASGAIAAVLAARSRSAARRPSRRHGCRGRSVDHVVVAVKPLVAMTRPLRSGWVASYPLSRTATFTPLPVTPAAPGRGRADLRHAAIQVRRDPAVQPRPS